MSKKGTKFDGGKLRYDLIPPECLDEVARVFTIGAKKYGTNNWCQGLDWGQVTAAMERHMSAWKQGEVLDPEDGQHHLASVAWGAFPDKTLKRML